MSHLGPSLLHSGHVSQEMETNILKTALLLGVEVLCLPGASQPTHKKLHFLALEATCLCGEISKLLIGCLDVVAFNLTF